MTFQSFRRLISGRIFLFSMMTAAAFFVFSQFYGLQNLFVIMNGNDLVLYRTFERNIEAVLKGAEISVGGGDSVISTQLNSQGGIAQVVITHSEYVTVKCDNKSFRLRTFGESVAGILERANIITDNYDQIEPSRGMPTQDGMVITVTRWSAGQRREVEEIAYETIRRPSKNLRNGTEKVVQVGVPGEIERVYQHSVRDGDIDTEFLLREGVVREPVTEIIEYGTGLAVLPNYTGPRPATYLSVMKVNATAYSTERQTGKHNASGKIARFGTIAVDPRVIPLGTKVYIETADGSWSYGYAIAEDTGGAIKGNIIDLFFDTYLECITFGRRDLVMYILE